MEINHKTIHYRIDTLKPELESITKTETIVKCFLEDSMVHVSIAGMFDGTPAEVTKVCALILKYVPDFPIIWMCAIRKGFFQIT